MTNTAVTILRSLNNGGLNGRAVTDILWWYVHHSTPSLEHEMHLCKMGAEIEMSERS